MKKIFLASLIFLASCHNKNAEIIEGTIYIKLIDAGSLYKAPKDKIEKIKNSLNNGFNTTESKGDISLVKYYKKLLKYDVLEKPYFRLKLNNGSIISVFTNEKNFLKIEPLIKSLNLNKELIRVKLKGIRKEKDLYFANEILSIIKKKGKTDWRK